MSFSERLTKKYKDKKIPKTILGELYEDAICKTILSPQNPVIQIDIVANLNQEGEISSIELEKFRSYGHGRPYVMSERFYDNEKEEIIDELDQMLEYDEGDNNEF